MKIRYERSGGVAGLVRRAEVDTEELAGDARAAWTELVHAASFFALPGAVGEAGAMRDGFTHAITVEDGDKTHAISVASTPAGPLKTLIERLETVAKGSR